MHYSELPASQSIVVSSERAALAKAIENVFGVDCYATHFTIATGGPSSCRVFFTGPTGDSIPLERVGLPQEIADELIEFMASGEARYPETHGVGQGKAWELRKGLQRGKSVLIAHAVWGSKIRL